jgi:hypothetical protein
MRSRSGPPVPAGIQEYAVREQRAGEQASGRAVPALSPLRRAQYTEREVERRG